MDRKKWIAINTWSKIDKWVGKVVLIKPSFLYLPNTKSTETINR